jgi:hypothetical protein
MQTNGVSPAHRGPGRPKGLGRVPGSGRNRVVLERIAADPAKWILIDDVVDLYIHFRNLAKLKRAEAQLLAPLNLTRDSFLANQKTMDTDLVHKISRDLVNFEVPYVVVIIAGVDQDSAGIHARISTIRDGVSTRDDVVGFSAIGMGARHAQTEFMLAGHAWNSQLPETMLLAYSAKRNAEIAPGVGPDTDMFLVGPNLGVTNVVLPDILLKLDREYRGRKRREAQARTKANREIKDYIDGIIRRSAGTQAPPAANVPETTPGGEPASEPSKEE